MHEIERFCGAKTRSGEPCKNRPVTGSNRCRMHGGISKTIGPLARAWKDGRRSKYLPKRLLESYQTALEDTELIALRDELSLLDARLNDLLGRVDTGEAGRLWVEAQAAWQDFRSAQRSRDQAAMANALDRLDAVLGQGIGDYAAWAEIENVINLRRRVAEAERRRLVDLKQMMTVEQAMTGAAALFEAVRRKVDDRDLLAEIQSEFVRLMGRIP